MSIENNPNDIFPPERFGLITGSKCSILFPKRSAEVGQKAYAKQLAQNMFFRFYDDSGSWRTEHGHFAESSAHEFYTDHFDKSAQYQPGFKHLDNFGGSADALTEQAGIDYKCPTSLAAWLDYLYEGISPEQYHQAQMYMFLYDRPKWNICAFLLETQRMADAGITYPVEYSQRMLICEVEREEGWSDKLYANSVNVIKWRDEFYERLKFEFTNQK